VKTVWTRAPVELRKVLEAQRQIAEELRATGTTTRFVLSTCGTESRAADESLSIRYVCDGNMRVTSRRASHTRDFIVPVAMRVIRAISSYVYFPLHHSCNAVRNRGGNFSSDRVTYVRRSFKSTRSSGDGSADTHSPRIASGP